MPLPVLTYDLTCQFENICADALEAGLASIQKRTGNLRGIAFQRFGQARAFLATGIPTVEYNRVVGFGLEDAIHIPEIVSFYRSYGVPFGVDILPGALNPDIARQWAQHGLTQTGFLSVLYGLPVSDFKPSPHIPIRPIQTPEEFALFKEVNCQATGILPALIPEVKKNIDHWFPSPYFQLFLAYMEQVPVATGMLFIKDGMAYLVNASTVPSYRQQGCQQALLHHRIQVAATENCRLVISACQPYSSSQHNLERAGLRLAYTKAIWTTE